MPTVFSSMLSPILLAGQGTGAMDGLVSFLLPLILIFGVFYLFIYRPQKKREEEHEEMVSNLEKGDKIVTIGGIHGTIRRIDEDTVLAQVDSSGTKLRIDKQAISSVGED